MQKPNTVKGTSDLLGQEALDQENIRNIFVILGVIFGTTIYLISGISFGSEFSKGIGVIVGLILVSLKWPQDWPQK